MSDEVKYLDHNMHPKVGDDSTPLIGLVPDPPPSHWGKLTSQARTLSPQYLKFLKGKGASDGRAD